MSAYDLTRVATKRSERQTGQSGHVARLTSALEEAKKGLEAIASPVQSTFGSLQTLAIRTLNRIKELTEEEK
jgi:hypothetical protein